MDLGAGDQAVAAAAAVAVAAAQDATQLLRREPLPLPILFEPKWGFPLDAATVAHFGLIKYQSSKGRTPAFCW